MRCSIVVPMLNEAGNIPGLAAHLAAAFPDASNIEIIAVDGGSDDDSPNIAARAGWRVIRSARGRARQLNAGAAAATADTLLFLHADTLLPPNASQLIANALADHAHVWGRFDVAIAGRHPMLRIVAAMMNLRSRLTGIATGDQAMFVRRDAFLAVHGFPEQPLMEDIELSRRLRRLSRPACLRARVTTSGRRWESHGVFRTIVLMWTLRAQYFFGVPASRLAEKYR